MFNVGDKLLIIDGNHSQVVNYRGPASSDSSMVWTGTMQIAIANDKLVKFDEHEADELRRREQVQHTPGAINLQPVDIRKDNDTWLLLYADRETAYLAASAAKCAPELAAENERRRGLLAECVSDWREEIEQWRASGQPQYAMALERCVRDIEARQEAMK